MILSWLPYSFELFLIRSPDRTPLPPPYLQGKRTTLPSIKRLPPWVWHLGRRWLRVMLHGLRLADGAHSRELNTIFTQGIASRDDLLRLCLHAGYAAHFHRVQSTGADQDCWAVSYPEDPAWAEPILVRRETVKEVQYSGRTFCVTVPSGLIVVRRASRDAAGRVTRASAPVILGNCWTTEMEDDGDPPRLWLPNAMFPGTAFTRSIGDSVAERIGVVAVPEICLKRISSRSKFAVIASDGVFEFLASQNVADIISRFDDPLDGARAVVSESYRLWLENEMRTDDITIVVVVFENVPEEDPEGQVAAENGGSQTQVASATFIEPRRSLTGNEREEPGPIRAQEEIDSLDRAMRTNFLFANLSDEQRRSIYTRMQRHVFYPGDIVIRQGDKGDNFYVVRDGILDVYISQGEGDSSLVHTYKASDGFHPSFGELALMHGKPRAATVVARTRCTLWALDREGFRSQVQRHSPQWLIQLLQGVDCLRPLKFSQLELMVNFMEELAFLDGEVIVRQGEEGDAFYIVTSGEVAVTIQRSEGEEPKQVLTLTKHQYFGEKALLSSARRAASVFARGFVRLLYITRSTFERILGPLTDLDAERQIWEENCRALAERRKVSSQAPQKHVSLPAESSLLLSFPRSISNSISFCQLTMPFPCFLPYYSSTSTVRGGGPPPVLGRGPVPQRHAPPDARLRPYPLPKGPRGLRRPRDLGGGRLGQQPAGPGAAKQGRDPLARHRSVAAHTARRARLP